jgi:aminoglycoside phosphotransferase (APT) family kinase protein
VTAEDVLSRLIHAGVLTPDEEATVEPLSGGVSSDIVRVKTSRHDLVLKAALPKLKVKDDWYADVTRNQVEQAYLRYASSVVPQSVPYVMAAGDDWFAMEYLGHDLRPWKADLMAGRCDEVTASRAGETLGRLHSASWGNTELAARFDTDDNFHSLRIEPYLLKTAERVPEAAAFLREEAARLAQTKLALVHGDFSPKNLLVNDQRLVILDAECGWFGDPAFDTAFLITHLLLKTHLHPQTVDLVMPFWSAYERSGAPEIEMNTVRLILCFLLARVHGKSPVEYLEPHQQQWVVEFGLSQIISPPRQISTLLQRYEDQLT